jgi:hypothetical protein
MNPRTLLLGCLLSTQAFAGSGPWVLAQGDHQLYVGVEGQRFSRFVADEGSFVADPLVVADGVSTLGFVGIASVGLGGHFEAELEVPWFSVFGHDPDNAVCTLVGLNACARTQGVGIIAARTKVQVVDEVYGAPLSLSLGLDLRFGQLTGKHRERITNLGEGTFDIEPRLSIGRIGSLGKKGGYWSVLLDLGFRYRLPLATSYPGRDRPLPGYELLASHATLFTPIRAFSFGPTVSLFSRPDGLDFSELDLSLEDRFAALRVLSLRAGGKVLVRGGDRLTFVLGVEHTLYAINNPSNVLAITAGLSIRDLFRRREEG